MNEQTPLGTINHITYYLAHGEVVRYQDGHEHLAACPQLVIELFGRMNELERELQQVRYGREEEALSEVCSRKLAVILAGSFIIHTSSFFGRVVVADVDSAAVDLDSYPPFAVLLVPGYALVTRCVSHVPLAIAGIFRIGTKPQIALAVVKPVAVDMVNLSDGRSIEDEAMKKLPFSLTVPAGQISCCVPITPHPLGEPLRPFYHAGIITIIYQCHFALTQLNFSCHNKKSPLPVAQQRRRKVQSLLGRLSRPHVPGLFAAVAGTLYLVWLIISHQNKYAKNDQME